MRKCCYECFNDHFAFFASLYSISVNKLKSLQKHYRENGCKPRVHKNSGRTFRNHLSYDDNFNVRSFIWNYAELHAILLPGRIPGFKRDDIKLLPSSETMANVWRKYKVAMEESGKLLHYFLYSRFTFHFCLSWVQCTTQSQSSHFLLFYCTWFSWNQQKHITVHSCEYPLSPKKACNNCFYCLSINKPQLFLLFWQGRELLLCQHSKSSGRRCVLSLSVLNKMTDVCWQCQKNSLLYKSANLQDAEKQQRCKLQQAHLESVAYERTFYRELVKDARETTERLGVTQLGPNMSCTRVIDMHYSFDYAQQVHFPADPVQPGPVYFLTQRKLGIFGVHCEGVTKQVDYLVDEGVLISKGSNAVISYLNHFFESYGLGETTAHLHCDNCSGQNKNRFVLWYMLWCCICSLHRSIQMHFMVVGHTKFAPDWCFGLFKQRYRLTPVSSLDDVIGVVTSSTQTGVNIPQLVGNESGNIFVPQFDWQAFLGEFFKPLHGVKSFQHFR